jgi:predicted AAA+ superfamily ATPase
LVAIEVKSGRRVGESELRGLRALGELPQVKRRLLVYRGDRRLKTADGIEILPVATFLRQIESSALFP